MARTRSRPNQARANKTRRTGGKRGSARPASIPDILTIGRFLFRPEMLGTALVVLAFAALPMLLPLASVLDDARDAIVRGLGLHAFTLVLVVAFFGAVLALRRGAWLGRHRRHALGVGVLLVEQEQRGVVVRRVQRVRRYSRLVRLDGLDHRGQRLLEFVLLSFDRL